MTSEQAMFCAKCSAGLRARLGVVLLGMALAVAGCQPTRPSPVSPYAERRVWAVAPLRNESGTLHADGLLVADHLARHFENVRNIDVLPVNRTLAAMDALGMEGIQDPREALRLLQVVGADALVIGTITAYDPYDPPKLGLAIELYVDERFEYPEALDVRKLTMAATSETAMLPTTQLDQPVSTVSAILDASDPKVEGHLMQYARSHGRGPREGLESLYRISMDLYTQYVTGTVSEALMVAEQRRLHPAAPPPAP